MTENGVDKEGLLVPPHRFLGGGYELLGVLGHGLEAAQGSIALLGMKLPPTFFLTKPPDGAPDLNPFHRSPADGTRLDSYILARIRGWLGVYTPIRGLAGHFGIAPLGV